MTLRLLPHFRRHLTYIRERHVVMTSTRSHAALIVQTSFQSKLTQRQERTYSREELRFTDFKRNFHRLQFDFYTFFIQLNDSKSLFSVIVNLSLFFVLFLLVKMKNLWFFFLVGLSAGSISKKVSMMLALFYNLHVV